jgi:hypothetical protein
MQVCGLTRVHLKNISPVHASTVRSARSARMVSVRPEGRAATHSKDSGGIHLGVSELRHLNQLRDLTQVFELPQLLD